MKTTIKKTGWVMLLALFPLIVKAQSTDTLKINLEQALQIALSDNPTIQIAEQEIQRVDYSKKGAWYGLIPTLNGSAQAIKYVVPGKVAMLGAVMDSPADYNVSATLSLALPLVAPGLWKSIQLSEIDLQLAVEKSRGSKIQLIADVKNAYYSVLLTQDGVKTLEESVKIAEENYRIAKQAYEVGAKAEYDVISSDVQLHNLYPQLLQAQNGVKQAKLYMKILLSIDSNKELAIVGKLSDYEKELELLPYNVSLDGNSSLAQMDYQIKMTDKQLQMQRTQRLPSLVGLGQYGYTGAGSKAVEYNIAGQIFPMAARDDWYSDGLFLGLRLSVPIFNGFTNTVKEKQIKIASQQLSMQRDYTASTLENSGYAALDNMRKAIEQVNSNKAGVGMAEKGYTISQKRYETGAGTLIEMQSAASALTQAKLQYSQAISDYLTARTNYEQIIGKQ